MSILKGGASIDTYSFTYFLNGYRYNYTDGEFTTAGSLWNTTSKVQIINNSIILNNNNFLLIYYWDTNDNYIGFQNTNNGSTYGSGFTKFLGYISGLDVNIPNNAAYFALANYTQNYSDQDGSVIGVSNTLWQNNTVSSDTIPAIDNIYYGGAIVENPLSFDGNDYVRGNALNALSVSNDYEIRITILLNQDIQQAILSNALGVNNRAYIGYNNSNQSLVVGAYNGTTTAKEIPVNINEKLDVIFKRVSGNITLFVNGVEGTTVSGGFTSNNAVNFTLGARTGGDLFYLNGEIYDLKIYDGSNNLIHNYDFNGSGNLVDSITSTSLTLTGATWQSDTLYPTIDRVYAGGTLVFGALPTFELGTVSYDNISLDVSSEDATPLGLNFSPDGTKMYVSNAPSYEFYQYTLSTPFDLSTATYDNISHNFSSQASSPQNFRFNNNGSKIFITDLNTSSLYQYSLSNEFDLSTATYDNVSFNFSSQDGNARDFVFNDDGTKLFNLGLVTDTIYQYSLSTAFDLSTITYDNISFNFNSQESVALGLSLNNNGTKLFIIGDQNDSIYQYSLSTPYNVGTASYDNVSFSVASQDNVPRKLAFSNYGEKIYIVGTQNDSVYQYTNVF